MSTSRRNGTKGAWLHAIAVAICAACSATAAAQVELLPVDHPASNLLIQLSQFGVLPDLPVEHLPFSVGEAMTWLEKALRDAHLPKSLEQRSRFLLEELRSAVGQSQDLALLAANDSSRPFFVEPLTDLPIVIASYRDSSNTSRFTLHPIGEAEVRVDPSRSETAVIARFGARLQGTIGEHVGFAAAATNGSIAGDLDLARRDSSIVHNGAFGVTSFGRDVAASTGHARVEAWGGAAEIGREKIALGANGSRSLLLTSDLPIEHDYIRLHARLGVLSFSHIHAALLGDALAGDDHGPFAQIPSKHVALHLLTIGPVAGCRLSMGESVVYSGRGFEIGYLNPFVFMKTHEQYLRDRDNGNLYVSFSARPGTGIFLEGELLIDDLRFSQIGKGYWGNKTAWRVTSRFLERIAGVDLGVSYTRLEPYALTHFNVANTYAHVGSPLSGGGLDPNSFLVEPTIDWRPFARLQVTGRLGLGRHGSNIIGLDSVTGNDTLLFNAGGDIRQTRRAGIDSDTVSFLEGDRQRLLRAELVAEYEPLHSVYLRLYVRFHETVGDRGTRTDTQIRFALRVGAH